VAIDVSTIGAFEINDDEFAFFENDFGVSFGNVAFRQNNIVPLDTSHRDLIFVEL
jgi:hypothetical protein